MLMNIIIRVDASVQIGSGHVMRCLTIAKKLREQGYHVKFWMELFEGNLISLVNNEGFETIFEAQYADLYIIDHYELGIEWEQMIRKYTQKIVVIDDLARVHDCDLLLDQNVITNYETRYDGKLPEHCVKLLGPKYLIMRDEFIEARQSLRKRTAYIKRLLVFMGGSDPTNETMKILQALASFSFEYVDIVVGDGNVMKETIQHICLERGYAYHCQIDYMASLMQQADFAIGAGGATTWERCYVGLPSSSTIVAENQIEGTRIVEKLGAIVNLGWHEDVTIEHYKDLLISVFNNKEMLEQLTQKGLELTGISSGSAWLKKLTELIR